MPKLIFRGARILDWTGEYEETGQRFKLSMAADFSDPVRDTMGWHIGDKLQSLLPENMAFPAFNRARMLLPDGVKTISLDGDLAAKSLELIPNDKDRSSHRMSLACSKISLFSLHRVKQPNGSYVWELRFTAVVQQIGAAKDIEAYIEAVGDRPAQMPVGYEKQEPLPLEGEAEEDGKQERLISKEQAADTAEEEEEEPEGANSGPTLIPAALAGGTHQRGSKQTRGRRGGGEIIDAETEDIVN